jgi:hypothetical protein
MIEMPGLLRSIFLDAAPWPFKLSLLWIVLSTGTLSQKSIISQRNFFSPQRCLATFYEKIDPLSSSTHRSQGFS